MKRLVAWLSGRLSSGAEGQYAQWRADTAVALPLLAARAVATGGGELSAAAASAAARAESGSSLQRRPFEEQLKLQQLLVYAQVRELLVSVYRSSQEVVAVSALATVADQLAAASAGAARSSGAPRWRRGGASRAAMSGAEQPPKSAVEAHSDRLDEYLVHRCGFALRVAPSRCGEGSGKGVFLRGRAAAGTVLGLYPGRVCHRHCHVMPRHAVLGALPWARVP